MQQKCSESSWEQRIVLYKSDQQQKIMFQTMNKYIFQNIIRQQTKHKNTGPDYSSSSHTHTHTFRTERTAVYQSPSQSKLWHLR